MTAVEVRSKSKPTRTTIPSPFPALLSRVIALLTVSSFDVNLRKLWGGKTQTSGG